MLVGDPGAGKSTFLRRIAFAACETLLGKNAVAAEEMLPKPCPFPILIRAASLAEYIRKRKAAPAGDHPAETDAAGDRIAAGRNLVHAGSGAHRRISGRDTGRPGKRCTACHAGTRGGVDRANSPGSSVMELSD
jgi:hypothetical protein